MNNTTFVHAKLGNQLAKKWEFLFCRGPLRAPLLNRSRHASKRDAAYVLPIHGRADADLAGGAPGRHVGGVENCDISIGRRDGGW